MPQSVNHDAQSGTVCDNVEQIDTSDEICRKKPNKSTDTASCAPPQLQALCEAVGAVKKGEKLVKAKKKRNISEAERERRRQSMLAILARKRERKAQAAV